MASKEQVFFNQETGEYAIQYTDSKGDLKTRDKVMQIDPVSEGDVLKQCLGLAKDAPKKRRGAVTLLALIMKWGLERDKLQGWRGNGARDKPIPNELKSAFQKCEDGYFEQFLDKNHPEHDLFVGRLPKENERGEALERDGKINQQARFEYFVSTTRREPSYANAKNLVLGFFNYCGQLPYAPDGEHIIPPEVMRVYVSNAREKVEADNSIKGKLHAIRRECMAEGSNPPDDDLPEIVATLKDLLPYMEGLMNVAAQRATARPKAGDVVEEANKALESAKATLYGGKAKADKKAAKAEVKAEKKEEPIPTE